MTNSLMIAVMDASRAALRVEGLDARVRAAMHATRNHWLVTRDEDRFRAALGGVLEATPCGPDRNRLNIALAHLRNLVRAIEGNLDGVEDVPDLDPPLPLLAMWREITETEGK